MLLYDTHAHLDDPRFDGDRDEVIEKIKNSSVGYVNNIGADIETSKASIALAEKYDFIYAVCGIHPGNTANLSEADMDILYEMAKHKKVRAIGEIGLDYHYEDSPSREVQRYWFKRQLDLSKEVLLPVVIHDRDSKGEGFEILKNSGVRRAVIHCFSGSAETATELLKLGFYISFTGVVTFKNARKATGALKVIPPERLFIETDCPYMAPEPFRGTRNDSSNVIKIAEKYAEIKGLSLEKIAEITTKNAKEFFGIN